MASPNTYVPQDVAGWTSQGINNYASGGPNDMSAKNDGMAQNANLKPHANLIDPTYPNTGANGEMLADGWAVQTDTANDTA